MPPILPMALGAGETTLLRMTTAYAMLVNGGKRITPTLIDRVQDRNGKTIFRRRPRACEGCRGADLAGSAAAADARHARAGRRSAARAYQMVHR